MYHYFYVFTRFAENRYRSYFYVLLIYYPLCCVLCAVFLCISYIFYSLLCSMHCMEMCVYLSYRDVSLGPVSMFSRGLPKTGTDRISMYCLYIILSAVFFMLYFYVFLVYFTLLCSICCMGDVCIFNLYKLSL